MSHLGDKLKAYRTAKGLNQSEMAEYLSIGFRTYQDIEKTGVVKKSSVLMDIMNKTDIDTQIIAHEPDYNYTDKRRDLKNNGSKNKVPVYGGFTTLGNIEVYDDENIRNEVVAQLPAEVFPGCDYAEKAKGDSMYPLIMNQAVLVGKRCSVKGITFGEKYIIKTKYGMDTVKFIHPGSKKNTIVLKAYNKSVPDQEVDMTEITFSCRVYWIINPT